MMRRDEFKTPQFAVLLVVLLAVLSGLPSLVGHFDDGPEHTIQFRNATSDAMRGGGGPQVATNFPGVYVTDYDRDGRPDVLSMTGSGVVMYENGPDGFERADVLPDLNLRVWGAHFLDHDGDGWDDLLLLPRNDTAVLLENDEGQFKKATTVGDRLGVPVGAASNDYDGDGDADIFLIQYGDWREHPPAGYLEPPGSVEKDNGYRNRLYKNTENGFRQVNGTGIGGRHWSLATSFVDLTGDGKPDIHVANDFYSDVVYVNDGDGTFTRRELGNATSRNAMSSEIADFNDDGRLDVFVTNIYLPYSRYNLTLTQYRYVEQFHSFLVEGNRIKGNNLLINRGNGSFDDRAAEYGVRKGGWGWAAIAEDFDGDGDDDLFHTTQITVEDTGFPYASPMLWERTDEGFTRRNASVAGFDEHSAWGAARFDYDTDGDVDVIVATKAGPVLYENVGKTGRSLAVRVASDEHRSTVLGARVYVTAGNDTQFEVHTSGSDFQSQDTDYLYFGVDRHETVSLRVVWPDGTERTFPDVATGQRVVVTRDGTNRTAYGAAG